MFPCCADSGGLMDIGTRSSDLLRESGVNEFDDDDDDDEEAIVVVIVVEVREAV